MYAILLCIYPSPIAFLSYIPMVRIRLASFNIQSTFPHHGPEGLGRGDQNREKESAGIGEADKVRGRIF